MAPQSIAGPGTQLLSVSSKGELAVLTGATLISHRLFRGTLARLTPGGSPRAWMDDVREADWSPDGESLAVIRDPGNGLDRLEYPIGTMLLEVHGYLSDVRVSHDGRRVAFVEHRYRYDDRGAVKILDSNRQLIATTGDYWGVEGLAWSPNDSHVVFSASDWAASGGISYRPHALRSTGRSPAAPALPTMADAFVTDIGRDGRWLLTREAVSQTVFVKKPGEITERDISWLDLPIQRGPHLRRDDSENRRIPTGQAGRGWRPRARPVARRQMGGGGIVYDERFRLLPDRRRGAADVEYPGRSVRVRRLVSRQHARAAVWRRIVRATLLQALGGTVAPDGSYIISESAAKTWRYPASGGAPTPVERPGGNLTFVGWSTRSDPFFVETAPDQSKRILYAPFGKPRVPLGTISVSDRAGLVSLWVAQVVGDAEHYGYLYAYTRDLSTLLVASRITLR